MDFVRGLVKTVFNVAAALFAVAMVMHFLFVDVIEVPHNGMAPTLVHRDLVLVWRHATADMANVMVCQHPAAPEREVLGRAIAFGGHSISSDHLGNLYVDNDRASTDVSGTERFYDTAQHRMMSMQSMNTQYGTANSQRTHRIYVEHGRRFSMRTYQVNRGMFLLGDNRSNEQEDSRDFGEVDPDKCRGQIFMRLRPAPSNDDDIDHFYFDIIR